MADFGAYFRVDRTRRGRRAARGRARRSRRTERPPERAHDPIPADLRDLAHAPLTRTTSTRDRRLGTGRPSLRRPSRYSGARREARGDPPFKITICDLEAWSERFSDVVAA